MRFIDLSGVRFGRLTVISRCIGVRRRVTWACQCDCGKQSNVTSDLLTRGRTKSCGCLQKENRENSRYRHGMSATTEHKIWMGIIERCSNQKSKFYYRYGGRGISICARWLVFENFFADMGLRPSSNHTLDRRDNDGNYNPENCRWSTKLEQANNKSNNVKITIGDVTKTLAQWCRETGVDADLASQRMVRDGWSAEDAVMIPSRPLRRYHNGNRDNANSDIP